MKRGSILNMLFLSLLLLFVPVVKAAPERTALAAQPQRPVRLQIPERPLTGMIEKTVVQSDQEFYLTCKPSYRASETQPAPQAEPEKIAYLTFDDGPNQYTQSILDTLEKYGINATFFMLAPGIKAHPELVQEMKQAGHALGLHGVTHDASKIYQSKETLVGEMEEDNKALTAASGFRSSIARVPYGSKPWLNPAYLHALNNAGYHLWDWNVDSTDSSAPNVPVATIVSQVEQQVKGMKRAVILLHDKKTSSEALPQIIAYLQKQGFAFGKIYGSTKPVNFWNDET